jgi:DNA-binding PadR family transcriptional regulator
MDGMAPGLTNLPSTRRRTKRRENRTRYAILGMLTFEPMTGYELRHRIRKSIGHFWHESYGQLYPTLRALVEEQLVTLESRRERGRLGGAVHRITTRGREELAAWLARPPVLEPSRNELLLKVCFAGAVPGEVTLRNLADAAERLRAQLRSFEAIAARWDDQSCRNPHAVFWKLTLEFGRQASRARLAWLGRALDVVAARAPGAKRPARTAGRGGAPGRGTRTRSRMARGAEVASASS